MRATAKKCAWCGKSVGYDVIVLTGERDVPSRRGGIGTLATVAVKNYWHSLCLEEFERKNEEESKRSRQQILDAMTELKGSDGHAEGR